MKYGWVKVNLADLWTEPKFNSERASQLRFAEPVRITSSRAGFFRIQQSDGYTGWVDSRFVEIISRSAYSSYAGKRTMFVNAPTARLYGTKRGNSPEPFFLYYGTRLFTRSTKDGLVRAVLPGKSVYRIKKTNLVPINRINVRRITGSMLVKEASRFLGVPYLWGGVTAAGFDCSGLVQTVLARFGIEIPRDTKDQIHMGEKIDRDCIKTGDLLFFDRHVGFAVGKDRIIHSSAGGGGVRINSLTAGAAGYREDLDRNFNQARRVLCSI